MQKNKQIIGNEESIVCSDGNKIGMSEIEAHFNGIQMKSFIKKPKIFIYDCCRGNNNSYVIENVNLNENNNNNNCNERIVYKTSNVNQPNDDLHKDSNVIKIYATTKGHKTADRSKKGSHLTESIEKIFFKPKNQNDTKDDAARARGCNRGC